MRTKLLLLLGFLVYKAGAFSQCAMCKAVAEDTDVEAQGSLNAGILYIMVIPYIILFFAFRKKISGFIKEFRSAKG